MNILLVLIDTLRADHLGCYGYPKPTSPNIDRVASEGMVFERAFSPGIPTQPAHTTLYTGRHPIAHNVVTHGGEEELSDRLPVLSELLQRAGYTTCAVDNLYDMKPWFARGYEFYINAGQPRRSGLMVSCEEVNRRAIRWLRTHMEEKFFLFVHYWDPHTPYIPPSRYRSSFYDGEDPCDPTNRSLDALDRQPLGRWWRETWFPEVASPDGAGDAEITDSAYIVALYDGEVRYADEGVGALLDALEETGISEETLVVITSDHGESLTEHDILFEHHGLYDCTIRVPLIIRGLGRHRGVRIQRMVQLTDLTRTILELAGAEFPEGLEGRNLNAGGNGVIVAEECTWQAKWALRSEEYKFILARAPDLHGAPMRELYDLREDPEELRNLAEEKPQLARVLEEELEAWICRRIEAHGLAGDPLQIQGVTLAKRWLDGTWDV